ncbi:MAG TPA: prephenate dehydratase domain-containing protein [Allosphingosinicella sp.]|jgi:prephenate dehydratase
MRVAYQGAAGAFGHQACLAFLPDCEPVPQPSFEAVIAAVESGEAERGLLPLDNNCAGATGALELLQESALEIVAEHVLPVRMHLLGVAGGRLEDVRTVVSHPVALKQCARTLEELGLVTEEAPNTALAAQRLSVRHRAVLASEAAAEAYGLTILRRDVHDRPDNATRFAVLARKGT